MHLYSDSQHDYISRARKVFLFHVFSKHGVSSHLTSDRGLEFVAHFFQSLGKALNIRLHFTSGHHLEGDGQTKWMNQTLEQYLRIYSNYQQDNWSELLPLAEFSYNNTLSATTGVSPFCANKDYHPNCYARRTLVGRSETRSSQGRYSRRDATSLK